MTSFSSKIYKIGINPYVSPPERIMHSIFKQSGKTKGPIRIQGTLNGHKFSQTLVKYQGKWRLYLNTPMRKAAGIDVGDRGLFEIEFNTEPPVVPIHPKLKSALDKNKAAKAVFESLIPSRQKEIKRYINNLKTPESLEKNVKRAINFLLNKERFIGRDKA